MDFEDAKILVIDDEAPVRATIVGYLEDSGFDVIQADNGEQGLNLFYEQKPDLVLCDLRMPRMDGLVVLSKIMEATSDVPFIVVSGAGVMQDVVQAIRLGAADYLVKPIADLAMLENSVLKNLERVKLAKENEAYREMLEQTNSQLTEHIERLQLELQAGRLVQQKMLPQEPLNTPKFQFNYHMVPSMYLSGDFVDYFELKDGVSIFYIADVSGHGASSAMITVLIKSLISRFRDEYLQGINKDILSLRLVLQQMNKELKESQTGKHATVFLGILDEHEHKLTYVNAAHFPTPIVNNGGKVEALETSGLPVGMFDEGQFEESELLIGDDFSMTLFSDGLLEIIEDKNLVEKERFLLETVEKGTNSMKDLVLKLGLKEIDNAPDDITILTVQKNSQ